MLSSINIPVTIGSVVVTSGSVVVSTVVDSVTSVTMTSVLVVWVSSSVTAVVSVSADSVVSSSERIVVTAGSVTSGILSLSSADTDMANNIAPAIIAPANNLTFLIFHSLQLP